MKPKRTKPSITIIILVILAAFLVVIATVSHVLNIADYCDLGNWDLCGSVWNAVTAMSTLLAAIFAICAYRNSVNMKKQSSFDAHFAQMMTDMRACISDKRLQQTGIFTREMPKIGQDPYCVQVKNIFPAKAVFSVSEPVNNVHYDITVYPDETPCVNFIRFYLEQQTKTLTNGAFSEKEIINMWKCFCAVLVHRAEFLRCFKYVYHAFEEVRTSPLPEKQKYQYISSIQAALDLDFLFCYMINQICAYDGSADKYKKSLKNYRFFKDLFGDYDFYARLIRDTVPGNVYQTFKDN